MFPPAYSQVKGLPLSDEVSKVFVYIKDIKIELTHSLLTGCLHAPVLTKVKGQAL